MVTLNLEAQTVTVGSVELQRQLFGLCLTTSVLVNNDRQIGEYAAYIDDDNCLRPYTLWVNTLYRGRGLGEYMMRAVIEKSLSYGADMMLGFMQSQYSLRIRERLFGSEAMRFYADGTDALLEYPAKIPLPATYEQIRQSLERAEAFDDDPEHRRHGVYVEVSLADYKPRRYLLS